MSAGSYGASGNRTTRRPLQTSSNRLFHRSGDQLADPPFTIRASAPLFIGIQPHPCGICGRPYRPAVPAQNISQACRPWAYSSVLQSRGTSLMLYAILCYHDEDTVGSWTKEQDAAVMKKLAVVQGGLTEQGRLGPVARLLPTTSATTLRKDDPPLVIDGPYAETKEQLLGFYIVDCKNLDEALDVARDLGAANPGGAYEIRPVGMMTPGSLKT